MGMNVNLTPQLEELVRANKFNSDSTVVTRQSGMLQVLNSKPASMPTVHKPPKANEDLFDIWGFIAADNIAAADTWIDKLDAQLLLLA